MMRALSLLCTIGFLASGCQTYDQADLPPVIDKRATPNAITYNGKEIPKPALSATALPVPQPEKKRTSSYRGSK